MHIPDESIHGGICPVTVVIMTAIMCAVVYFALLQRKK